MRRGGAAIGWSVAFFVLCYLIATGLAIGGAWIAAGSLDAVQDWAGTPSATSIFIQGLAVLVAGLVATWAIGIRVNRLDASALRYEGGRRGLTGFGGGFLLGGVAAGLALIVAVVAGSAEWVRESGSWGDYAAESLRTALILAPAALAEEVLFRGVPLVLLAAVFGRGAALVAIAVLFGLAHLANPGVTPLAVANIAGAGIFLGLAFYAPGGILTAFGAHLGWNATLAALDAPVSGLPFDVPAIDYDAGGPPWLTGGVFGPEGGLSATAALVLACLGAARWTRKDLAA